MVAAAMVSRSLLLLVGVRTFLEMLDFPGNVRGHGAAFWSIFCFAHLPQKSANVFYIFFDCLLTFRQRLSELHLYAFVLWDITHQHL